MHLNSSVTASSIQEKLSTFMKLPGVSEILEWTFMYDNQSIIKGLPYNKTFFDTIGGTTYMQWENGEIQSQDLIARVHGKFDSWIHQLQKIIDTIVSGNESSDKSQLEREGIEFMILGVQAAKSATSIELEKASTSLILTIEEREQAVHDVELGQTQLYGPKVSENLKESTASLEMLCEEFYSGKTHLNTEQRARFILIYDRLVEKIQVKWGMNIIVPDIRNYQEKSITQHHFTDLAFQKIRGIKISKEVYIQLWQQYIHANGLPQKVVTNPDVSSVYDGPSELQVPDSESYQEMSLNRVLSLMIHEIGSHYVNQATSENNGFEVRGAKNIEKEEGLAIVMEGLFEGNKLANIRAGYSFPYILTGELLTREDRQDLINLRSSMNGNKWDEYNRRDLRVMRGFPLDGPGAQRKDTSYGRGANRIVELLQEKKCSIVDLYKGKFSIDDSVSGRLHSLIPREKIVFPLLFPEMLLFLIGAGRENFTHKNFMNYLKEKYSGDVNEVDLASVKTIQEFSKLKIFITMWREIDVLLPKKTIDTI